MSDPQYNLSSLQVELARLISPGIVGFYNQVEVTEVFAMPSGTKQAVNVFTLVVAEDRLDAPPQKPTYLGPRIKLNKLRGWTFGIQQYSLQITGLIDAFTDVCQASQWQLSGEPLQFGKLIPSTPQFVPPDSAREIPLNRVLKNNFWNGSHILEWSDHQKKVLQPLFADPRLIQELSEAIQKCVPLALASLSDRLGNILVQLPVTVCIAKFKSLRTSDAFTVELAWHPKATPRILRASCELEFDRLISGYSSAVIQAPETQLPMQYGRGMHRGLIWDDQNHIILAATGQMSVINTAQVNTGVLNPEPRVFTIQGENRRIALVNNSVMNIGEPIGDSNGGWTDKRIYQNEAARLAAERRFVQYKPKSGQQDEEHERALNDVRLLINQYGQQAAWLWDPYLSADDILQTLFHCSHFASDLRGLTAALEPKKEDTSQAGVAYAERQRKSFENAQSNLQGLRLEYRAKIGQFGWGFHDRFLIFPKTTQGALAWSLGASVNALGKQHNILQRVDDGQLVTDAFVDLWEQLDQPEHLIWKAP